MEIDRLRVRTRAPGGWAFLRIFLVRLQWGQFPKIWKLGKLVILRKKSVRLSHRPITIALLDDVAKIFEKIIADCLIYHLIHVGPDLADNQFVFGVGTLL